MMRRPHGSPGARGHQPNVVFQYQDGRIIEFVGTLGGSAPNPLNGGAVEQSGTMIIDVTNPAKPVEKFHLPGVDGGYQERMARMCGSEH